MAFSGKSLSADKLDSTAVIGPFREEYRFLSNFWLCPVIVQGETFPSAEHAYQALKAKYPERDRAKFLASGLTPGQAKRLARTIIVRSDWERKRVGFMQAVVREKFLQNPELRDKLLATGNATLVEENSHGDVFWGACNGQGENHLGRILMATRDALRVMLQTLRQPLPAK
jgi:ribA/ribD-fused uncharacterized protein